MGSSEYLLNKSMSFLEGNVEDFEKDLENQEVDHAIEEESEVEYQIGDRNAEGWVVEYIHEDGRIRIGHSQIGGKVIWPEDF